MIRDMLKTGLLVIGPVLLVTMVVGLVVNVLQVITQVQEMSLSFIPKLVAACACLAFLGSWMLRMVLQFSIRLWTGIPSLF